MALMRISDLAKAGGVGIETIRFYQRKGLLRLPDGSGVAARHYANTDLASLRFIRRAQAAGFTLAQIAELLALDRSEDRAQIRELARARLKELEQRIAELEKARAGLEKLVADCAGGRTGPCPIVEAFAE